MVSTRTAVSQSNRTSAERTRDGDVCKFLLENGKVTRVRRGVQRARVHLVNLVCNARNEVSYKQVKLSQVSYLQDNRMSLVAMLHV